MNDKKHAKKPENPTIVDSPLPKKKVEKKPSLPVSTDPAIDALKDAGVPDDVIKNNTPIVNKFRRGLYPLEHTIKALKNKE